MTQAGETGLLQAIVERPDEDVPRRIYADWLEDHGQPHHAEFVRLQLDLARVPSCDHPRARPDCVFCAVRLHEAELLAAHGAAWLAAALPGTGWLLRHGMSWLPATEGQPRQRLAAFARGLVEAVFLPLDDFLQRGDQLFACRQPLRRVQLTDRHPRESAEGLHGWSDAEADAGHDHHLPLVLSQYLPSPPLGSYWEGGWPSEADALAALSRACLAYLRRFDTRFAQRRVFTTGDVAKMVQVSPRTVCKWFDSGRLRGYRLPGSQDRRIPREQLVHFLKQHCMELGVLDPERGVLAPGAAEEEQGTEVPPEPAGAEPAPASQPSFSAAEAHEQWRQRAEEQQRQAEERWSEEVQRLQGKEVFSMGEVALLLRVAPRTVRQWFDAGRLGGQRAGGGRREVPRAELLRFIQQHNLPVPSLLEEA
jgi:uncharacterized protein (TIGR02996 family)/excisionase family DNA binding protein